jgi:hypothetical protein
VAASAPRVGRSDSGRRVRGFEEGIEQTLPSHARLFFGTLAGAAAYVWFGLWCVVLAIAIIAVLLVWAAAFNRTRVNLA